MMIRSQIRPNGKPGVSEIYWGLREILTVALALISILITVITTTNGIVARISALESRVDSVGNSLAAHETNQRATDEHVIRNTEWIDAERARAAATTPPLTTPGHSP